MRKHLLIGKQLLRKLHAAGYEAFFVGGFVRDTLLKLETKDIDITTNALPMEVKEVFNKVISTGEKYGTVTVIIEGVPFEVTTYRTEQNYSDYRRPDDVKYAKTLKEDLSRRDFTINQLVMDDEEDIMDYHNGLEDLNNHIIRTINDPNERFKEDALRMLRAFRFSAKLDFDIEEKTLNAIQENGELIKHIAIERIQDELMNLFSQPFKQKALKAMIKTGIHHYLFRAPLAIEFLASIDEPYDTQDAFVVLYLEGEPLEKSFKLSKKMLHDIKQVARIHALTIEDHFTPEILFTEKISACLSADKINIFYEKPSEKELIISIDKNLPIKEVCELAYKGEHIIKDMELSNRKHIGFIIDHLILEVIYQRVPNTYEALKEKAFQIKKQLEKSDLI
ncbi:CCA tRNA nucleotidyltransferase [Liberiplasma polymorphum]|uniref:CCA tRNA nucleotidyltransferase n=1 Tax=Liberiplasma polymorphum TaxID=3374570 RepID=UPI0037760F39